MDFVQSNNRILIISDDNFIVGLLTGYCLANHLSLESLSRSNALQPDSLPPEAKVIIIDLRDLTSSLAESYLTPLKSINNQYATPICAIHTPDEKPLPATLPWINYFQDDTFIEKLDNYIDNNTINFTHAFNERRNYDRRSGAERRTLSRRMNNFPAKQLNDKTTLANTERAHHILGLFEIDKDYQTVYLKGKDLELTRKEFKLFNLLAEDPTRVCSTEKIISHLWPDRSRANKSDLYQYMHLLRKKVESDPDNPRWIITIKGIGYKFNASEDN